MIGTSAVIGNNISKDIKTEYLNIHKWVSSNVIYSSNSCFLLKTIYKDYPYKIVHTDDYIYTIEGFVYETDEHIQQVLINIINSMSVSYATTKKLILSFIEEIEGDYIIQIYNKRCNKYLVFNDFVGSLPLYFSFENGTMMVSRTLKFILDNKAKLSIDLVGLAQKLSFDFSLGNNTSFSNIKLLESGSLIFIDVNNIDNFKFEKLIKHDFILSNPFKTRDEAIDCISKELINHSIKLIKTFENKGYAVSNTLSGGFDSRIILSLLSKTPVKNVANYTFEYIQDESSIAKPLWNLLEVPGTYKKLDKNNINKNFNIGELQFNYDGRVGCYTNLVCHKDTLYMKKSLTNEKNVVLNGFGGELFRKPYKSKFLNFSIKSLCSMNFFGRCSSTQSVLLKENSFLNELNNYKENKQEDQIKHLYWEYYLNFVIRSGEDRGRSFTPVAHPLINRKLLLLFSNRVPLQWINFEFFIDILKQINPKSLKVSIFNSSIDLNSLESIKKYDNNYPFDMTLNKKLKLFIKYLLKLQKSNSFDETLNKEFYKYDKVFDLLFSPYMNKQKMLNNLKGFGLNQNSIISELVYFSEIFNRFKDKIDV